MGRSMWYLDEEEEMPQVPQLPEEHFPLNEEAEHVVSCCCF